MITKEGTVIVRGRLENSVYHLVVETVVGEATFVDAISKSWTI